ncbi:hypothetical protein GOP47_0021928 [Adiantum capillus-veneris]|uniref:DUF599 domain-containing protein n=1 Tax=Adiantum capillus-veneris TaxID=13818 RepID=A0A9D4U8C4_ADICA|nr:hypothetical protein GOP47_0021928 [Adiantum capillus-veneris]
MEKGYVLEVVLVPAGVLLLLLYHARLLYRLRCSPTATVIGVNQINRQVWVRTMMADGLKNGVLAVQTLRNNIMASTLLATAAILLCSLLAVLVNSNGSSNSLQQRSMFLGGNKDITLSTKLLCVLICFIVAFLCNVQSVRYYSHVSFLISIPLGAGAPGLTPDYVNKFMVRGGQFWSIGLRAFYFSIPMFLWLFGPIPMFVSSVIMATMFHFLDTAKGFQQTMSISSHVDVESGEGSAAS